MNERFQNALKRIPQATPPVWMMRQAGRYHKHYQALRAKHSFMELCKDPLLAAQVALGPIEDFDFDVAILFSDLLFPLEAMGMGLEYKETGPELGWHLNRDNVNQLRTGEEALSCLRFQKTALEETRKVLPRSKSLIGFVGGPWTLFTYAVEGAHKGQLLDAKRNFALYGQFCERLVPLLEKNIELQLEGGAEVVMIFDTAAGELSPQTYGAVVSPHLAHLAKKYAGHVAYYSKGTTQAHLEYVNGLPFAGLGVDHRFAMKDILASAKHGFRQGNFDQAMLFLDTKDFVTELERFLTPMRAMTPEQRAGWVCGLGHGVLPRTPEEHVRSFVKTVRQVLS